MEYEDIDDEYDGKISILVKHFHQLRKIEFNKKCSFEKKYNQAQPLISKCYTILDNDMDFLVFRHFWTELHDRMGYYYDYLNKTNIQNSIPMFRVSLHNRVVIWYSKLISLHPKYKKIKTLLHFDSHEDMSIPSNDKLCYKNKKLKKSVMLNQSCGKINYPVTCFLMTEHFNKVYWLIPEWIYDTDISTPQYLSMHCGDQGLMYYREKSSPKDEYRFKDDVRLVGQSYLKRITASDKHTVIPFMYHRIHTEKTQGFKKLAKTMEKNEEFVLDIDLDYFVTNGDKYSKTSYRENFWDLQSTDRVHDDPGIRNPRDPRNNEMAQNTIKKLEKEKKLIQKRISVFLDGLKLLKRKGCIPAMIGLSGSTPSFFSGDIEKAAMSNNYTPKYFVPLIQHHLIRGFSKLYSKNFD